MSRCVNGGPQWCSEKNKWVLPMSSKDLGYSNTVSSNLKKDVVNNVSLESSGENSRLLKEIEQLRKETEKLERELRLRKFEARTSFEEITRRKYIIENLKKELSDKQQKLTELEDATPKECTEQNKWLLLMNEKQNIQYKKEIRDLEGKISQRYEEIDYLENQVTNAEKHLQTAKERLQEAEAKLNIN